MTARVWSMPTIPPEVLTVHRGGHKYRRQAEGAARWNPVLTVPAGERVLTDAYVTTGELLAGGDVIEDVEVAR